MSRNTLAAAAKVWARRNHAHLRNVLVAVAAIIFASQWVRVILRPQGDFALHWLFGARFRAGEPLYAGNMHVPYPPFWALACTPLSILPMPTMRALLYPFGIVPLAGLLWILRDLTRRHFPIGGGRLFWATAAALILSSRFLIRELPDNGVNLALVALSWLAILLWARGRDRLGGTCLGLAIALKCTPALFLAYFAWKRQWRMVICTTLAALAFTLSPAIFMGRQGYVEHMRTWAARCLRGVSEPDPMIGVLGEEEVKNVSLRPGLARFLMRVPREHKGFIPHPWRFEFLDLAPATAGLVVKGVAIAILAGIARRFRAQVRRRDDLGILWECALVSVLLLLLSPITWRQHCVGVVPAFYLIAATAASRGSPPRSVLGALGIYVLLVLVLDRGLIGRDLTLLLDGYSATMWALLALLAAGLMCRGRVKAEPNPEPLAGPRSWRKRREFESSIARPESIDPAEGRDPLGTPP